MASEPTEPYVPLNRESRRQAKKNGAVIPVLNIRLYPDGSVVVDKHGDVTTEDIRGFLNKMLESLPDD